jgi:hypothetical protein
MGEEYPDTDADTGADTGNGTDNGTDTGADTGADTRTGSFSCPCNDENAMEFPIPVDDWCYIVVQSVHKRIVFVQLV